MLRLSNTTFSEGCHDGPNWSFVRQQLSCARNVWTTGEAPPLPLLVGELAQLGEQARTSGRLPIPEGPRGRGGFKSFSDDLARSVARTGPRVLRLAEAPLGRLTAALDQPCKAKGTPNHETWTSVFEAAGDTVRALAPPTTVAMAADDLLDQAARDDEPLPIFFDRLDTLRAVVETQNRSWSSIRQTIEQVLTAPSATADSQGTLAILPADASADEVRDELRTRLAKQPVEREWAVWVAGLAGGAALKQFDDTVVSGAITVCGLVCHGNVSEWLPRAKASIERAFVAQQQPVPPDVKDLGGPMMLHGKVVLPGEHLWQDFASPPSFVSRVSVAATSAEEAKVQAHAALGAAIGRDDSRVASDLRPDSIVWTAKQGWLLPSATGRGKSQGEVFATRTAVRAADRWAADLGSPLDDVAIRLMQDRALVHDFDVPAPARVLRAAVALEALPRPDGLAFNALPRLWLRWALETIRRDFRHLVHGIALSLTAIGPPASGKTYTDLKAHQDALEVALSAGNVFYGLDGLAALEPLFADVHPHADSQLWRSRHERLLTAPNALSDLRRAFVAMCERTRRHRNLAAHGWSVDPRFLEPSARDLALILEIGIVAHSETMSDTPSFLGDLTHEPDDAWQAMTANDLLVCVTQMHDRQAPDGAQQSGA